MKKMILPSLLLFLMACHNKPVENVALTNSNNAVISNTENADIAYSSDKFETIHLAQNDEDDQKQGLWLTLKNGKVIKSEIFEHGKLVDPK